MHIGTGRRGAMSPSGGEGDEMEEVSDAGMQPLGDAGAPGDAEIEQPPVIEPARKRRRIGLDQSSQRDLKHDSGGSCLLHVPAVVLQEILDGAKHLQSAGVGMHARNAAFMQTIGAERRSSEALGFCTTWTEEIKEHFMKLQKRDMCDARFETRQSFTDEVTNDQRYAAVEAAQQKVRKRPRDQDPRFREYFIEKLQEFVCYFVQIMTRNASPGDYFARIRRLSKPLVDAFVRQLDDETASKQCPSQFSLNGVWTIDAMLTFIIQNETVLLMKEEMCESLQRDVDKCRKKYKKCKRQVDFSTGGFRPWVLEQQALAQKKAEEDNWRIGSYHNIFIFKDA